MENITAQDFVDQLTSYHSPEELKKIQRYFKTGVGEYGEGDVFLGVRMGQVFELAKVFVSLPLDEIERLLESSLHEVRAGAVKIMALQFKQKHTAPTRRQELYELYLRRHDRINNWDLVDLGAWDVVGAYLWDKLRQPLYTLANSTNSTNLWERRTAMLSTFYFIKHGELSDTFKLAEILLKDEEDLIAKAVGGMLRAAGKQDRQALEGFLDRHAPVMSRITLRYALEHFDQTVRNAYLTRRQD